MTLEYRPIAVLLMVSSALLGFSLAAAEILSKIDWAAGTTTCATDSIADSPALPSEAEPATAAIFVA